MNIVINKYNKFHHTIVKNNRIGNKVISKERIKYKDFYFNGNLYSINIKEEMFTNFVKSYDKKIYKEIKNIFDEIYINKVPLENKFKLLENEYETSNEKIERLERIIKSMGIEKVPSLMKLAPYHNPKDHTLDTVRIYVYYDKNTQEFYLYLIDLYHLGIDARNKQGKYDLKKRYEINSMCNKCISKISDQYVNEDKDE